MRVLPTLPRPIALASIGSMGGLVDQQEDMDVLDVDNVLWLLYNEDMKIAHQ